MKEKNIPLFKVFMPESAGESVTETLFSGYIAEGPKSKDFRESLGRYIGNENITLVNSGTSALKLAYLLSGAEPGSEIISTPLTCIATNTAILETGAEPVWADCDPETGMTSASSIKEMINEKTRAAVILHKEGDPADLDEISKVCKEAGIYLIEDSAHALGTRYKGLRIGNHADFSCFSFQAIKHITTGDGGALVCRSPEKYDKANRLKWFGLDREKYSGTDAWLNDVTELGYKMNLNDIGAALGLECLKHIDWIINRFHENGEFYNQILKDIPGITQIRRDSGNYSSYWAYCLLAEDREGLRRKLKEKGIASAQIHARNDRYSIFQMCNRELPGVDYFAPRELSLPCGWWVSKEDIEMIADIVKQGW